MAGPGGIEAGRVSVRVLPDLTAFRRSLQRYLERIEKTERLRIRVELGDTKEATARIAELTRDRKVKVKVAFDRSALDRLTTVLGKGGTVDRGPLGGHGGGGGRDGGGLSLRMKALLGTLVVLAPLIGDTVAGLGQASGVLTLLPAAGAAAAVGIGSLVVAFNGFGTALKNSGDPKKFAAALKNITPAAREAVKALVSLKPLLSEIRKAAQEAFFTGLAKPLEAVGKVYLPLFKTGLAGVAREISNMVKAFLGFLQTGRSVADTAIGLNNTKRAFAALVPAIEPVARIFRELMVIGSTFLPGLADGFARAAKRFADFLSKARGTGELSEFIQTSLTAFADLSVSIFNAAKALRNVFTAGQQGGASFLKTLRAVTDKIEKVTGSADVQEGLGILFAGIAGSVLVFANALEGRLGPTLVAIAPAVATLAVGFAQVATAISGDFAAALIGLAPNLEKFAREFFPLLAESISNLAPGLHVAGVALGAMLPPFLAFAKVVLPPLSQALNILAPFLALVAARFLALKVVMLGLKIVGPILKGVVLGFRLLMIAFNLMKVAFATSPIGVLVIALAALALGLKYAWDHSQKFRTIVMTAFEAVKTAGYAMAYALLTGFRYMLLVWLTVADGFISGAAKAFGWIPGIGDKLKEANKAFDGFKDQALATIDEYRNGLQTKMEESARNTQIQAAITAASMVKSLQGKLAAYQAVATKYKLTLNQVLDKAKVDAASKSKLLAAAIPTGLSSAYGPTAAVSKRLADLPIAALRDSDTRARAIAVATGAGIADGIAEGIRRRRESVIALAGNLGVVAANAARHGAEVFSPSKITTYVGEMIGEGLIVGMQRSIGSVTASGVQLGKAAANAIAKPIASAAKVSGVNPLTAPFLTLGREISRLVAAGIAKDGDKARRATADLARKVGAQFLLSMQGTQAQIRRTTASTTDAIRASILNPRLENIAISALDYGSNLLVKAASAREAVVKRLADAKKQLADAVNVRSEMSNAARENAAAFAGIIAASGSGPTSADNIIQVLRERLSAIKDYAKTLNELRRKGVSEDIIKQIAAAGIDQGGSTAAALATATKEQIAQINGVQAQIAGAAKGVGDVVYQALSDAGIKAAQGLVKGLESQQKQIEAVMLRIAKSMQNAIKTALGIHSPSQVFADIGKQVPNGMVEGIESRQWAVHRAIGRMARTATAAAPSNASWTTAGAGGQAINFHGNVGWDPDEVARRIAVRKRDALAIAGLGS